MKKVENLNDLMNGAANERLAAAIEAVLQNVFDPNTEAKRKRKVTLILTVQPSDDRETAKFVLDCKPTLAPPVSVSQTLLLNRDDKGNVSAHQLGGQLEGQMSTDDLDVPTPNMKVVNFDRR